MRLRVGGTYGSVYFPGRWFSIGRSAQGRNGARWVQFGRTRLTVARYPKQASRSEEAGE